MKPLEVARLSYIAPVALAPNQPRQFYRGGSAIAAFRGIPTLDDSRPEDWVASITPRAGQSSGGLTTLPDGRLLADAVRADPEAWLGADHAAHLGADTALLVKLLDAAERLPVHVHPTRDFAQRHLGCRYGKTEAWVVLETSGSEPLVHVGFQRDIEREELAGWMASQDTVAMLSSLHAVGVAPGDTVLIPAGTPHAIGAGVFCAELQEPTDFSVMLEWSGFGDLNAEDAFLGLDPALARECVRRDALSPAGLAWLRGRGGREARAGGIEQLFPVDADAYFLAERIRAALRPVTLTAGFSVLVVLHGRGRLEADGADAVELERGATLVVPHAAGPMTLSGPVVVLRCRPPSTQALLAAGLGRPS